MSNKLKKFSEGYNEVKGNIRKLIEDEGGVNVTPEFMNQFTKVEDDNLKITEDEFYTIIAELSDEGYRLYKISQVCKGKETKGMMICSKDTTVAFVKDQKKNEESSDK